MFSGYRFIRDLLNICGGRRFLLLGVKVERLVIVVKNVIVF